VKDFFFKYYVPNNAVMVVAGNVTVDQVKKLSEKWFGPIPRGNKSRDLSREPIQDKKRFLNVSAKVPANAFYKAYHMPGRFDKDYYAIDLLSDILSRGQSSRLYQQLVKQKEIFTSISSFVLGSIDPGLFLLSGRVKDGISLKDAESEVQSVIDQLLIQGADARELDKVKNQTESTLEFGEVEVLNRAMNLAFAKLSGNAELVNEESKLINVTTLDDISRVAHNVFREENSNVLYYEAEK
jgi:zinc protease